MGDSLPKFLLMLALLSGAAMCLELKDFMNPKGVLSIKKLMNFDCEVNSSFCRPISYRNCLAKEITPLPEGRTVKPEKKDTRPPHVAYLSGMDNPESPILSTNGSFMYELDGQIYLALTSPPLAYIERVRSMLFFLGIDGGVEIVKVNRLHTGRSIVVEELAKQKNLTMSPLLQGIRHLKYDEDGKYFFLSDSEWKRFPRYAFDNNELWTLETPHWTIQLSGEQNESQSANSKTPSDFFRDPRSIIAQSLGRVPPGYGRVQITKERTPSIFYEPEYLEGVFRKIYKPTPNPPKPLKMARFPSRKRFRKFIKMGNKLYHRDTCLPVCRKKGDLFRHPLHCDRYYICKADLKPVERSCNTGHLFTSSGQCSGSTYVDTHFCRVPIFPACAKFVEESKTQEDSKSRSASKTPKDPKPQSDSKTEEDSESPKD